MATDFTKYGKVNAAVGTNKTDFSKYGAISNIQPEVETKQPSYFERVGSQFSQIGGELKSSLETGGQSYLEKAKSGDLIGATGSLLRSGLRATGAVAGGAFAPVMEAPIIKPLTERVGERLVEIPGARDLIVSAGELTKKYPNASKDIQNIVDIVTLGGGKTIEQPLKQEAKLIGKDITQGIKVSLTPSEEAVQNNIVNLFNKSVKPSVKSISQGQRYENATLNALKTIKSNADKLNIEDISGELVSRTPETIQELRQAVDQTKDIVFKQYDELAKKAGKTGATIDTANVAKELETVAQNKALQLVNPDVIKYAQNWAERLKGFGVLDTETTQEVIKLMNKNLDAFYRNPSYDNASKVAIDAGVANNFRKSLDEAITGATGEQYQVLKNQYSALKSIEDDVVKAAARDAKRNVKGLLDYTDIFTGGQMISGILSLNPAMFTKGAVERLIKEGIGRLNDPNRAIKNLFEKLNIETGAKFTPQSATGKYLQNPKLGMSIEDVSKQGDNLLSEARKYKSAEEFVNGQGTPVYHGGTKFDPTKVTEAGFSVTENKKLASEWVNGGIGGFFPRKDGAMLNEFILDPKARILSFDEIPKQFYQKDFSGNLEPTGSYVDIVNYAKEKGYDAVDLRKFNEDEIRVMNPAILKTKSQLTDIWNKANKITDEQLISKLSDKQKQLFKAGSKEEQKRALEQLRLKYEIENNQKTGVNPF